MASVFSHGKGSKAGWAAQKGSCKYASLSRAVTSLIRVMNSVHHGKENARKAGLKGGTWLSKYNKDVHKAMWLQSPWLMGFTKGELVDLAFFWLPSPRNFANFARE